MPRSQPPTSSTFTESTTSLGLSAFHERYRLLEEEHQWFLKQIKRKRTELKNFFNQMRTVATQIFAQAAPLYQKLNEFDTKIHGLFEEILTQSQLGKNSRQDILGVYHSLQSMGLLSQKKMRVEEDEESELDDLFNDLFEEEDTQAEENFFDQNARESHQSSPEDTNSESSTPSPEAKPIRQTFLRLAALFHPDKVTDPETKMHHTEVMKEVNRAYQEGDIARLLEIEKQHHQQVDINPDNSTQTEIERLCIRREQDNQLLKTQYENLKKELRVARNTPSGEMVKNYRACKKQGIDAVDQIVLELETQVQTIENIYKFVQDFRDKKITIKEFIQGLSWTATHE